MTDPRAGCRFFFPLLTLSLLSRPPLHAQPLLTSSSLSLYSQLVSTLIQRLISLPLSPDQVTGEEVFFLFPSGHPHGARATRGDGETGGENRG